MKQDIIQQFNLPSYIKRAKSVANASELIRSKFKDRTDMASKETEEELLSRLAKAQEYIKMQESLAKNAQQVPDMMDGQVPEGMEQFFNGGNLDSIFGVNPQAQATLGAVQNAPEATMADPMATPQPGGQQGLGSQVAGLATGALSAGQDIFGDTGIDTAGGTSYDVKAQKKANASGAIGGLAKVGTGLATGNPLDIIGGGIQTLGSIFGGKRKVNQMNDANAMSNIADASKQRQSDFAKGGKMTNTYAGDDPTKPSWMDQDASAYGATEAKDLAAFSGYKPPADPFAPTVSMTGAGTDQYSTPSDAPKTGVGKAVDWMGKNYGNILQYAPVVGNLTNKLEKPNTERGTRVQGRYVPQELDLSTGINAINQQNIDRAVIEQSGGDQGAATTNLLMADLNKKKGIAQMTVGATEANRAENRAAFQMDRQADMFNAQLDEAFLERKARDTGAYNTAKQAQRSALYEDLGKIGKEQVDKDLVKKMFGYSWDGKYFTDDKGNKYTSSEVAEQAAVLKKAQEEKATPTNEEMFGGYLKGDKKKTATVYKRKNSRIKDALDFRVPGKSKLT